MCMCVCLELAIQNCITYQTHSWRRLILSLLDIIALHLGVGAPEKSPTHTGIATVVIIVKIVLGDSIVEISGVQLSVTHRRHFLIADVLVCWLSQSFYLPSLDVLRNLHIRVVL